MTAVAVKKPSPRAELRAWFSDRIENVDDFELPEIEAEARDLFLRNPEWVNSMFGPLLGHELRALVGQMRDRLALGDHVTSRRSRTLTERADALAKKWGNWFEHTSAGYVRLMAMTKVQLIEAAAEREQRGQIELRTARLWRALASELTDEQTVREHFRPEQIEAMEADILAEQP